MNFARGVGLVLATLFVSRQILHAVFFLSFSIWRIPQVELSDWSACVLVHPALTSAGPLRYDCVLRFGVPRIWSPTGMGFPDVFLPHQL